MKYVTWKDLKAVTADLKPVYRAATADEAERQLGEFEAKWTKYSAIGKLWLQLGSIRDYDAILAQPPVVQGPAFYSDEDKRRIVFQV